MEAILALGAGRWFRGLAAGAAGEARGEVVLNRSLDGDHESLPGPAYAGHVRTMPRPEVGNYRRPPEELESRGAPVGGLLMRQASPVGSHWGGEGTLRDYLITH